METLKFLIIDLKRHTRDLFRDSAFEETIGKRNTERHAFHIAIFLCLGVLGTSVAIGVLLGTTPLILSFDSYFYEVIHKGLHFRILDFLIAPFNFNFLPSELSPGRMPSYYYFMISFTVLYLLFFKSWRLALWAFGCFVLGIFLGQIITAIDWYFVFRDRPFLTLPNNVEEIGKSAWRQLSSYPSGHARETALFATIISGFIPKLKWVMIGFTLFIAYSRVYIGAHYPTDVIVGVGIGFFTAKITLMIARELQIIISGKRGQHGEKPR